MVLLFLIYFGGKDMTKTASTQGLQKAMEQKQVAPTNTGVDPYRKAQSYLKAMLPAITEALPKSKGMDAERLVPNHLNHFEDESKTFRVFDRIFTWCRSHKRSIRPRTEFIRFMLLYPL